MWKIRVVSSKGKNPIFHLAHLTAKVTKETNIFHLHHMALLLEQCHNSHEKGIQSEHNTFCINSISPLCLEETYQFVHRQRCKRYSLQRHSEEYSPQGTWKQHLDLRNKTHKLTLQQSKTFFFFLIWILQWLCKSSWWFSAVVA